MSTQLSFNLYQMATTYMKAALAVLFPLLAPAASAGSIADIKHVVLFMQENRAFDHYFGTMAGVRGFSDPNVQVNPAGPVWQQSVKGLTTTASYLLPWYLNYKGGSYPNATQCMAAGSNGWGANHAALNGGLNDQWATDNTPYSWGHFKRSDIPVQFAIADGWAVGDMYQESVIASTNPNRVTWVSGSVNVPGGPQNASQGGNPYIDNNESPGCESGGFNCYPLSWKTAAEYYQAAGVSWSVFQDADNFDDNPLAWFSSFQKAAAGTPLHDNGMVGGKLADFYAKAANGTLPAVSYIVGPAQLSEHPPYSPRDGAWLQKQVVNAVTSSPAYPNTALLISYDETGGWGDHVTPYHSPSGTAGEWLNDPYGQVGYTYAGPGFRLPFYIVSPWTRGGSVFTEPSDHNSQILFIEKWLAAKGINAVTSEMSPWRRNYMSNLVNAFDFANPDYSIPNLPYAIPPHKNAQGVYDGSSHCQATYASISPPVPYTTQVAANNVSSYSEQGFKPMRGALTEGRYITFEANGYALANPGTGQQPVTGTATTSTHSQIAQRWVVHNPSVGTTSFTISSAKDGRFVGPSLNLGNSSAAASFSMTYTAGQGYAIQNTSRGYLSLSTSGKVAYSSEPAYFKAYSVTYSS